jgi:hypothetical protein
MDQEATQAVSGSKEFRWGSRCDARSRAQAGATADIARPPIFIESRLAVVLFLGASILCASAQRMLGQRSDTPSIRVAPLIVADRASQVSLGITVGPPEAVPTNTYLRVRGMPPRVSLTEGHAIGPGSWAIPLGGLPSLKANIPVDAGGRAELSLSLLTIDGKVLAEASTALTVGVSVAFGPETTGPNRPPNRSPAIVAPPSSSSTPPTPQPAPRTALLEVQRLPQISAQDKARAETILARGETYLANGSIEAAREFFERAAKIGLARAALRLAATYDPAELQRLGVQGVEPDHAKARNWYERAKELGATEAEGQLARLSAD